MPTGRSRSAPTIAGLLAPLSYVQVISATLVSMTVFHEALDVWTMLGIVLIVSSGLYVVRQRSETAQ